MDLRRFGEAMIKRSQTVEKNITFLLQNIAVYTAESVIYGTPVDTSKALSNWQGNKESPILNTRAPYYAGILGSTKEASARAALDQVKAAALGLKLDQAFHITNNLPYIKRLNEGYSKQAPAAFVQTAILVGVYKGLRSGKITETVALGGFK